MTKRIVGIKANYYPEKRNFTGLPVTNYSFEKKLDFYRLIAFAYFKLKKTTHPQWLNLFYDFNIGKYDLLHFFNAISLGNKPWITTFEYYLPRGAHQFGKYPKENKYINKVIKKLAGPNCKQLIALSEYAKNEQINYLSPFDTTLSQKIIDKIIVIHPPQQLHIDSVEKRTYNKVPELLIVGADFFRKGGLETLSAINSLKEQGIDVKITIVSRMQYGDYASQTTKKDLDTALSMIDQNPLITWHKSLPNTEVINLFKKADIALLPSYDETYGYTVLEAQACGCPVITTNGAAFTEINNSDCGWVIDVPLSGNRSIPRTDSDRILFKKNVISGIESVIKEVLNDPTLLMEKGQNCIDRIKKHHSVEKAAEKLSLIYDSILKNNES